MNEETLKALRASIAHWEDNARAKSIGDTSVSTGKCALCALFYKADCKGCPVAARTGETLCDGSPYDEAADARLNWHIRGEESDAEEFREAARAEVEFLKSLLPPEDAKPDAMYPHPGVALTKFD